MALPDDVSARLQTLLAALFDERLSAEQTGEFRQLLRSSPEAKREYVRQAVTHAKLQWLIASPEAAFNRGNARGFKDSATAGAVLPVVDVWDAAVRAPLGYFSIGWPLTYLIVGVVVLFGLLTTSSLYVYTASNLQSAARSTISDSLPTSGPRPVTVVGRITGLVDCEFSDSTAVFSSAHVFVGKKFKISSGLVEITYDTGTKVILQGPCVYEVQSANSGYLALGKLAARVEKGSKEVASGQWSVTSEKSQIQNPKSKIPPAPSLSILHSPLFIISTPTAIITDIGTEFGIEVDKQGRTAAHVFRGSVQVSPVGNATAAEYHNLVLRENESVRIEMGVDKKMIVRREEANRNPFVRKFPKATRIDVFNTGVGLKEGEPDPHWQIAAVSNDPNFTPRQATVTSAADRWLPNDSKYSQWISVVGNHSPVSDGVVYTFRTTFQITDARRWSAFLYLELLADDAIEAIRLNGHELMLPRTPPGQSPFFTPQSLSISRGFVAGTNVLEIAVASASGAADQKMSKKTSSLMGFRVQLNGTVNYRAESFADESDK